LTKKGMQAQCPFQMPSRLLSVPADEVFLLKVRGEQDGGDECIGSHRVPGRGWHHTCHKANLDKDVETVGRVGTPCIGAVCDEFPSLESLIYPPPDEDNERGVDEYQPPDQLRMSISLDCREVEKDNSH